jgi:hypothetical protein
MTLESLKAKFQKLSLAQRKLLATWIADEDEAAWDEQIKADYDSRQT